MLEGLVVLPWWGYILVALALTHVTIVSVTVFLHRHQAHRALDLHPAVSHFFRFWLWLTTGMVTKEWVAVHRKHHAKCETEDDPHSPQVLGINKVLWQGTELYREESKKNQTLEKFGHSTPDDWLERTLYTPHSAKGIVLMLLINIALFGPLGVTIWAVQMIWIPFFAAGVINGIGHYWGYRNFECPDASTNISPWGIIIGGEELHNNHHTYPSSAKLSIKWWEFDIGWTYIKTLSLFGLAKVKRLPPKPILNPQRQTVDLETVKAVVVNRFQVMARFTHDVMHNVHREELQSADRNDRETWKLLKRARRLMAREVSLLDEEKRQKLQTALSHSPRLQTVYAMKEKLQDIWQRSASTQEHLLSALEDWCRQAEATGIQALREFSRYLRSYSLPANG